MTVYLVYCNVSYEGSYLHSIHLSESSANTERDRIASDKEHSFCDSHSVESKEVQP
jgi:hypothetical protein